MNSTAIAVVGVTVVIAVGAFITWMSLRRRKPKSLQRGLTDFQRGLDALDPANDPLKRLQQKKKLR